LRPPFPLGMIRTTWPANALRIPADEGTDREERSCACRSLHGGSRRRFHCCGVKCMHPCTPFFFSDFGVPLLSTHVQFLAFVNCWSVILRGSEAFGRSLTLAILDAVKFHLYFCSRQKELQFVLGVWMRNDASFSEIGW
jgi:hypothetical protein